MIAIQFEVDDLIILKNGQRKALKELKREVERIRNWSKRDVKI